VKEPPAPDRLRDNRGHRPHGGRPGGRRGQFPPLR